MLKFLRTRVLYSLAALFGLVIMVFLLAHLGGSPARFYLPEGASQELIETYMRQHGLDRPLVEQFWRFLGDAVRLDFGQSMRGTRSASEVILSAFPQTLLIAAIAMIIAVAAGTTLGCLAALRPFGWVDRTISTFSLLVTSIPDFWLALVAILVFAVNLRWLPTSGQSGPLSWILPVFTLCIGAVGGLSQVARGAMVESLSSGYVQNARARGFSKGRLVVRHALKNALLPVVSVTGDKAAHMFNGTVIICVIFTWPGVGGVMINAVSGRDFPVLQAGVFFVGLTVILINIAVDLAYAVIDPRIRIS